MDPTREANRVGGVRRAVRSACPRQAINRVLPFNDLLEREPMGMRRERHVQAGPKAHSRVRRLRHAAEVTGSCIMLAGFLVLALFG